MKKNIFKNITLFLTGFAVLLISIPVYPASPAIKSQQDYGYILSLLRNMRIMVENFPDNMVPDEEGGERVEGNNEIRDKYNEIHSKFQRAGETHFSQDFANSYHQFRSLKLEIIDLLNLISLNYKARTRDILDSLSTDVFEILVEYGRGSPLTYFFREPFDPMYDQKPYNPKNHHLFYNREIIVTYLRDGYRKFRYAQDLFNDPEIEYILSRRNLPSGSLNYVIERYMGTIRLCREAKQLGIEIYKIGITRYELEEQPEKPVRAEYKINIDRQPIFDDRIPDQYKIDANDNRLLIHSIEKRKLK